MSGVYKYNPKSDQWGYDDHLSWFYFDSPENFIRHIKLNYRGPKTIKINDKYWRNCYISIYETNITNLRYSAIQIV
jgi:hypothetical protein